MLRTPATWRAAAVLAAMLACLIGPAGAQDTAGAPELPDAALKATGAWTPEQNRQVQAFVDAQLKTFTGDDARAISASRETILEPLNSLEGGSAFQSQYFRLLAQKLKEGLGDWSQLGRVNAMMLARRVVDPSVTDVLEAGLKDESAGVRFGAAKSLGELLPNEALNLNDRTKERLLTVLADAASTEPDAYVAGKLLPAISATNLPAARGTLIDVFNQRVVLHAADPALSYRPELTAMQEVFIAGIGQFNRNNSRAFVQAATRYLRLAGRQLNDGKVPETKRPAARDIITQAATILDELTRSMNLPGQLPAGVAQPLSVDNFGRIVEIGDQWNTRVQGAPLNLDAEELAIDDPNAPAPAPEDAGTDEVAGEGDASTAVNAAE